MRIHRNIIIAFIIIKDSVYTGFIKSLLTLSTVTLTTPVFQGCEMSTHPMDGDFTEETKTTSVKLAVHQPPETRIRTLDAFVYNDDALKRIDSYQRSEDLSDGEVMIGSCGGKKIVVLCANAQWEDIELEDVYSLQNAATLKADLENEDISRPVMSALAHIDAGSQTVISLERLSSEIELRSVRSDFSGKPYDGEHITDARAYLTNVNATYRIISGEEDLIERIINHRSLIQDDILNLKSRSIILDSIGTITSRHTYPGIRFLCYPNTTEEESLGTPFTRLVLEGKIQGETFYWPININRGCGTGHEGIERNRRYVYDIIIKSKGTKDPDIPIIPYMAETLFETDKWIEKEPYHVTF